MKKLVLFVIFLFFLQTGLIAQGEYPGRIVSLSPAVTEILYELGLGEKVVGVTDYCFFPEDAKKKTKVGCYMDVNYEAIILLKPDLVIIPVEYGGETENAFDETGIAHMAVNTGTADHILGSIMQIGERCGARKRAEDVIGRINKEIARLKKKIEKRPSQRVMVVVGRDRFTFDNIYIAGKNTFYSELLTILGCENVYEKKDISYPNISVEGILRLNPDVIIEVLPNCPKEEIAGIVAEWNFLNNAGAVRNRKVYVLNGDYVCIPGPRFILILKDIAEILQTGITE